MGAWLPCVQFARFTTLTTPETSEVDTDLLERIKKGGATRRLKLPDAVPGRSWRKIFRKKGAEQKGCNSQEEAHRGTHWSLDLRSTPKRAALRASQGFRASRETSDIIHCVNGAKFNDQMEPNPIGFGDIFQ